MPNGKFCYSTNELKNLKDSKSLICRVHNLQGYIIMSSTHTGIEWTDKTWNPTTGCNKVSPGCLHCYAEALTKRFPNNFKNGFDLTLHPERLEEPLKWRTPSRVFVNSMSDLFHEDVPLNQEQTYRNDITLENITR